MTEEAQKKLVCHMREKILKAGHVLTNSKDISPANKDFHAARYELYELASAKTEDTLITGLQQDTEIRKMIERIFPVSCEAGIYEECAIAEELLNDPDFSFDKLYRSYYGDIYKTLMNDELDVLSSNGIRLAQSRIAYIGGGAMPLPAILLARLTGCQIVIVDPHQRSSELASALAEKLNLSDVIGVSNESGETADYAGIDLVWMANWIPDKEAIFNRINQFKSVSHVIVRSAADNSLSFIINDSVDDCKICKTGFNLLHKTAKRPNLSLISMIFENKPRMKKSLVEALPGPAIARPAATVSSQPRVVDSMMELIGNTPLLKLDPAKTGLRNIDLYAKLEHLNPFGSVKDRTALAMLEEHIEQIAASGRKVLELSSGNAARALQAIASIHGTALETISNRIRIDEMRKILRLQGAKVTPITCALDPKDAYAALNFVDKVAAESSDKYFYTDQYRNPANLGTHEGMTGREIADSLGAVDHFIGSIGTAGSSVGIATALKNANGKLDITGVVSEKDDFVPGIRHQGEIFDVGPYREKFYNRLISITAQESIDGILDLVRLYGVMAGPSSGAAYKAALRHLRTIDASLTTRQKAVFVVCDRVEGYLSYIEERRPDLFAV